MSAFVILVREGLEAILIVAAIVALLIKANRRDSLPWVHVGWIGALILGGLTWVLASYVINISGATREVTEGVTALIAAAILLYVGFWMHSKSYARQWQDYLARRLQGALSGRTMGALALVSFLAVYREAFRDRHPAHDSGPVPAVQRARTAEAQSQSETPGRYRPELLGVALHVLAQPGALRAPGRRLVRHDRLGLAASGADSGDSRKQRHAVLKVRNREEQRQPGAGRAGRIPVARQ